MYVIDAQGCDSEWNITFPESIKIEPVAIIEYGCEDNLSTNTVTVTVDESITDLSELVYSLDASGTYQTSNIFTDVAAGTHFIEVSHLDGCIQNTDDFEIAEYTPLALTISDSTTDLNTIVATATGGTGTYQYTFNGVDNGSSSTYIIYSSGDYTVTVTDSNGCFASATSYFEYIDLCIPNYFTPDGDGINDGWGPGCVNTTQYKNLTVEILDRYGRKIATLKVGDTWDGKYNGKELPSGDYWYLVNLNNSSDNRSFVGHFTLYR